jgi:microbial collagenase
MNFFRKHNIITISLIFICGVSSAAPVAKLEEILSQVHVCSPTITLRSESLTSEQITQACSMLSQKEARFHALFDTTGKPVANDHNSSMRANIYSNKDSYAKHVTEHFDVPSNNGGMYLEGLPHLLDNQAEFVAYEQKEHIWNLGHEYIHYLDGRFNSYGDFCASLHDNHSGPEYCPQPSPLFPHLVWWGEGIAEYVANGDFLPEVLKDSVLIGGALEKKASKETKQVSYAFSELLNTSYEHNGGGDRIYQWGYLAVRFMMENHRTEVEHMLSLTRKGYYAQYQALAKSWGTRFDAEFSNWLIQLKEVD